MPPCSSRIGLKFSGRQNIFPSPSISPTVVVAGSGSSPHSMIGGWSNPGIVVTLHTRDPLVPSRAAGCSREITTIDSGVSGITR